MNKRLKDSQRKYKEKAPEFTESDKQSVLRKVKQGEPTITIRNHFFPKLLTVAVLTFALGIGIYFLGGEFNTGDPNIIPADWDETKAEADIKELFQDDYFDDYFTDFEVSERMRMQSLYYEGNQLFSVETNFNRYLVKVDDDYNMALFESKEEVKQHKLRVNDHGNQNEGDISELLESQLLVKTLMGNVGEVDDVQYISGNIYKLTTTSFPDTFLMTMENYELEVYGPEKEINECELTGSSDHWEADYSMRQIGQNEGGGDLTVTYIGEGDAPESIIYKSEKGGFSGDSHLSSDEGFEVGSAYTNCDSNSMDLTIEWEGHKEELKLIGD